MKVSLAVLRARAGIGSLLSNENSNPKIAKNTKIGQHTAVLHLAPGDMSGHEVCPKRSPGCSAACLHFAGAPQYMGAKTKARIARTKLFFADRNTFMNILALEIAAHIKRAHKLGLEPSIRLNGTSDICYEAKKFIIFAGVDLLDSGWNKQATNIIDMFPTVQFYDYTAIPNRRVPLNYNLTFSMKENNNADVTTALRQGLNIAVVFPTPTLPDTMNIDGVAYSVINGDEHDFRPADPSPCVVGLKAKGKKGKSDSTGFVRRDKSLGDLLAA